MRPSIVMLHGSNGSGATMRALAESVGDAVDVYTPNMLAHGGRPVPERVTIEALADDIIAYMDGQNLAHAYVFGYSSGACLALYLARHFPQRFDGVCTLAAKYVFDEQTVAHWTHLTDPERLGRPGSKRAAELTETHAPQDWVAVTSSNRRLFEDYGRNPPLREDDLRAIKIPALLFSSDNDQLVPLAETRALGEFIRDSRVVIYKGQAHPLSIVPIAAMGNVITKWIAEIEARGALDRELGGLSWALKPPLVVIHGANGSGATMQALTDQLEAHMEIFAPDLVGHGGRPLPERLTIEEMASDVIAQMDERGLRQTYLFGYSSGGYLALYLARHYPERFIAVSALAVKYVFDARTVAHWTHLADPKRVRELNDKNGRMDELIRTHHPQDWARLVMLTCEYFRDLGRKAPLSIDDLRAIRQPVMLFASDNDQVVPLDESTALGKLFPDSRTVVFKGQSHPFKVVPVAAIARAFMNWVDELQKTKAASVSNAASADLVRPAGLEPATNGLKGRCSTD